MRQQRGMALLSVLLILTLALLIVEGLVRRQRVTLAGTAVHLETLRLRQALLEAEAQLLARLPRWKDRRPGVIHAGQAWAQPQAWALDDGTHVEGRLIDLTGRFNLEWLARPTGPAQFGRLLEALEMPPVTWPEGRRPAWRDPSQARLLPGITRLWLARLDNHVAWMPPAARINVNTAQASLLVSLGIPMPVAMSLTGTRPPNGFATVQAWRSQPALEGLSLPAGDLAVNSRWFRVELAARSGQRRLRLLADVELAATDGRSKVLRRWIRAFEEEAPTP